MENELFDICCDRDPNPADQRKQILKLLKAGADVHATDKNGVTALHHAVRFRSPTAVKALIELGANVNQACRRNGSTPLHRAATQTGAPGTAGRGRGSKRDYPTATRSRCRPVDQKQTRQKASRLCKG